ncbi:MAG: hypothetical protein ACI8RZ_006652 [Myxococcota bacterium]|jgi:hypothetical protein
MVDLAEVVSRHIKAKWKEPGCSLCGANNWAMNGPFGLVPAAINKQGFVTGYRTAKMGSPVISMVCYDCGNTVLLDYNILIGMEP